MRILNPYLPPEGYVPGSVELNHEEGLLDIKGAGLCHILEESQTVAESLTLRCELRPLSRLPNPRAVRLISEGELLEEGDLYAEDSVTPEYERSLRLSQWQGVALLYGGVGHGVAEGEGFSFQGLDLPYGRLVLPTPLYIKPFQTEGENYQLRTLTTGEGQTLSFPPGALNTKVLRGYGGYYYPGIGLEEIEQIYYTLTAAYEKTKVRLYSSAQLRSQNTPPPQGGREFNATLTFSPTLSPQEILNLPGCLAAGYASLEVRVEGDPVRFFSYSCRGVPGSPSLVEVSFRA